MEQRTRKFFVIATIASGLLILNLTIMTPSVTRVALALPLILFLPGYGITAILFPRQALDFPTRLLLSLGLSLTATAFSGLILHLTPLGVRLENPWIVLLIGGTGLLGLYFLVRDTLHIDKAAVLTRMGINTRQVLFLALAAVIATTAVMVARIPSSPENLTGYTLLWAQAASLPDGLEVGVQSQEFDTTEYQLRFEINQVLREGPTFELKPGEMREYSLKLDSESLAGQPITVFLYRLDRPSEDYRRVVWWYEND